MLFTSNPFNSYTATASDHLVLACARTATIYSQENGLPEATTSPVYHRTIHKLHHARMLLPAHRRLCCSPQRIASGEYAVGINNPPAVSRPVFADAACPASSAGAGCRPASAGVRQYRWRRLYAYS